MIIFKILGNTIIAISLIPYLISLVIGKIGVYVASWSYENENKNRTSLLQKFDLYYERLENE